MNVKFIKIPAEYLDLFPIKVGNMKIQLIESRYSGFYVSEKSIQWNEFFDKLSKDKDKSKTYTPLFDFLKTARRVNILFKETDDLI